MITPYLVVTRSPRERVLAVLTDELTQPGEPLDVNVPISDLGADSLDVLSLQHEIAKALDIAFSDEEDFTPDMTAMQIVDRVIAKVGAQ
jgi:acyl carrier protein